MKNARKHNHVNRRAFLTNTAGLCAMGIGALSCQRKTLKGGKNPSPKQIVILGGGLGGCAAALSALMRGHKVILTEETDWVGGQSSAQGVPPDENRWVETFGATRLYQQYRESIRAYYRTHYPMTETARTQQQLNPGNGGVSAICHEPRVSLAVLQDFLAPYHAKGQLTLLLRTKAFAATTEGDRICAVRVRNLDSGKEEVLEGAYFLDATELGDLLPLTGTEYVTGAESQAQTGELHAAAEAQPHNMQAFTCCFAMDYLPAESHVIEKPGEYDFWRSYVPRMTPPWAGPLLNWRTTHPVTLAPRDNPFDPLGNSPKEKGLWHYRQILETTHFTPNAFAGNMTLVNWPQNDYWLGNLCEVSEDEAQSHLNRAKQLSLSLLYWMQTEAPRADGKTGWPGLRLRRDVMGTDDGLAKHPYIRESRRIRAEFTVLEQHVGKDARKLKNTPASLKAEPFFDSVGIGYYRIDLHPSTGGNNYIDVDSLPFQIPLGALIPQRVENLLPACKNLGVTHITNGCYRLHPVEWNIGEAAGALAAFCLDHHSTPRQVRNTPALLGAFQQTLEQQGVRLAWPEEIYTT